MRWGRDLSSVRAALLLAAVLALTLAGERKLATPTLCLLAALLGTSLGGLSGVLASLLRSRWVATAILILPGPLFFAPDVAYAIGRLEIVAPWIGDVFVWLLALGLASAGFLLGRFVMRRSRLSPGLVWILSGSLGAALLVLALGPLQGLRDGLLQVGPYVVLLGAFLLLLWPRAWRGMAFVGLVAASLAMMAIPARYEPLLLAAAALCIGFSALTTRSEFADRAPGTARLALLDATWCVALLFAASLVASRLDDRERAALPKLGLVNWLLRTGQRATDFDGDGVGSAFGQRDCAPRDAAISPRAHERPGDQVDENCSRGAAARSARWLAQSEGLNGRPSPYHGDIVLLVIDTLRYDDTLDPSLAFFTRLREQGVWFERAYSASTFTSNVLVSLLTAKVPSAEPMTFMHALHGVPQRPVGGLIPWLVSAGYQTGFAGGAHEAESQSFRKDKFLAGVQVAHTSSFDASLEQLTAAVRKTRAELGASRPRFLYVHVMWMHRTLWSHEPYHGALRELDVALGALHAEIGPDALWIVTSDHGEEYGEHGGSFHASTLFDEVVHVPLAALAPELPARRVTQVTATRSLFPTLAVMTAPERAPEGYGPYLCLEAAQPCRDQPVPMALEVPGVHLHGLILGHVKLVRDLNLGVLSAYDLAVDAGELQPRDASAAHKRALEDWEEHAFGETSALGAWPYR